MKIKNVHFLRSPSTGGRGQEKGNAKQRPDIKRWNCYPSQVFCSPRCCFRYHRFFFRAIGTSTDNLSRANFLVILFLSSLNRKQRHKPPSLLTSANLAGQGAGVEEEGERGGRRGGRERRKRGMARK